LSEKAKYEIVNVDAEDKSFDVKLTDSYKLISSYGMEIRGIEAYWRDGKTERYPFFEGRDFNVTINRRIDLSTGKVLYILPDSFDADSIYLVFTAPGFENEIKIYITGYSKIGYTSFPWERVFKPEPYPSDEVFTITTPAGKFVCYPIFDGNYTIYYDVESNICVQFKYEYVSHYLHFTDIRTLSKVVPGRSWDSVEIILSLSDNRIDVGTEPVIEYSAHYAYDSKPFNGEVILNQPSSVNEVGNFTYSVKSIVDPLYGVTAFTSNNVTCIWDRVKIVEGGVSRETVKLGEPVTIWFNAEYEYDSELFNGSKGVLYVNGEPMEWSLTNSRWEKEYSWEEPGTITVKVTGIRDDKYGLTVYNDAVGPLSITITKIPTTLTIGVSETEITKGDSLTISGSISPAIEEALVTLTFTKPDGSTFTKTVLTDTDGSYSDSFTPTEKGEWSVKASWEGDAYHEGASSSSVSFTVEAKRCIIATATYGSELSPEVQFLRGFRDNMVLNTFAGGCFMTVFNAWYYSFSPAVASIIASHELLRNIMKILLYPLIGILHLSAVTFSLLGFNAEFAIVVSGLVASSLIGITYFTPAALILYIIKKMKINLRVIKTQLAIWTISLGCIAIAEIVKWTELMMISTAMLVLSTISLVTSFSLKYLKISLFNISTNSNRNNAIK